MSPSTLEDLTSGPRLFSLLDPSTDPRRGFLFVKDNHAHWLYCDSLRRDSKRASRGTPLKFFLASDGSVALLDSSYDTMGPIAIRHKYDEKPSSWTDLELQEHDATVLGDLTWVDPRSDRLGDFGRFTYTGELPHCAALVAAR